MQRLPDDVQKSFHPFGSSNDKLRATGCVYSPDELVDAEIVIRPHSPNDVGAEFRSPRMDWSGELRRHPPGQLIS